MASMGLLNGFDLPGRTSRRYAPPQRRWRRWRRRLIPCRLPRLFTTLLRLIGVILLPIILFQIHHFFLFPPPRHPTSPLQPPSLLSTPWCLVRQTAWALGHTLGLDKSSHPLSPPVLNHLYNPVLSLNKELTTIPPTDSQLTPQQRLLTGRCDTDKQCPFIWLAFQTRASATTDRFTSSLTRLGIPYALLGFNTPWQGFAHRMRSYHDFLLTIPPSTIVILSDADDVVALNCSQTEILDAYHSFKSPIVISTEPYCWPNGDLWWHYPEIPPSLNATSHNRYINAGTIIGTSSHLRSLLASAYLNPHNPHFNSECADDQGALTHEFLDRQNSGRDTDIALDYYQRVFISLQATTLDDLDVNVERTRVRHKGTGGTACILHQNGDKRKSSILKDLSSILDL